MKIIGLTGGIGSGKSTTSSYLAQKGCPVIDADQVAREMVGPDSPVLKELTEAFGPEILLKDGSLDRKALADTAFSSKSEKEKLDSIMLRQIVQIVLRQLEEYRQEGRQLIALDAPLLFEAGLDQQADQIWIVDAEDEVRIQRVMERDGATRQQVEARINNQMSRQEQRQRAQKVLNNSTVPEDLYKQIDGLLEALNFEAVKK
ncbi:dephospho-CoA kinase [Aminipila butyrica]|uniref:Dephospho-CoA kinase n=1 Tax=Aminipila butyrica TaxID=433296 RepID=A0A858BU49_9FIRM|nr:dephospho-CoA kinase [Aminipila butyrica]QIB69463.1 dephospho-CoA kinase [Aminipila butyrica]